MEFAGNDVNHAKADPDKDRENIRTFNASFDAASPHCMINLLMCSMVEVSSYPKNLVNLGILYL